MRGLLFRAVFFAALLPFGNATAEVDERWHYTLELDAGAVLTAAFQGRGESFTAFGGRAQFLAPVAENVQVSGGAWLDTRGQLSFLGGVRLKTGLEDWQSRLDLQAVVGARPGLGLGARTAAGFLRCFGKGVCAGLEGGFTVLAVRLRVMADVAAVAAYGF